MIWGRSLLFYLCFCFWLISCGVICLPILLLPTPIIGKIIDWWLAGVLWQCRVILKLTVRVEGGKKLPSTPIIYASKHQSVWETLFLYYILKAPAIVLKQELLWIPFFGWYLGKIGMIPLTRSKKQSVRDLKNLLKKAQCEASRARSILIFPEGTRSAPGQKGIYQSGIASLYQHLKLPVIPIAHNAGLFWPRRGFLKYPGEITLSFLPPIQPGFPRNEFMSILENQIETKTNTLVHKGRAHVQKP